LILTGVAAGLSILVKIAGLYLVAGVLISLAFIEQTEDAPRAPASNRFYSIMLSLVSALFVVGLALLVARSPGPAQYFHFVLPGCTIAFCLVWRERNRQGEPAWVRFRRLLLYVTPFLAGVVIPLGFFLIPYLVDSSVDDLLRGVFVLPARRFQDAAWPPPPLWTVVFALPLVWLLFVLTVRSRRALFATLAVVGAILTAALLAAENRIMAGIVWASMRPLIPLSTFVGVYVLLKARHVGPRDRGLLAVIAVASMASLVQFPWSQPMYFIYVAPLAALALTALVSFRPLAKPFFSAIVLFYLLFAVGWLNTGHYSGTGPHPRYLLTDRLSVDRGGLRILPEEAQNYEQLVDFVRKRATGNYLLATPDCPEVYFLTGLRNPTRWIFEFLQANPMNTGRLLHTLEERGVNVVVINEEPRFSEPLPSELRRAFRQRYPASARVGKFTVRWMP
ncbi:MAG: hypothetical protein ACREX3_15675, partial [Gammaproteobacteria bacterium]